MLNEGVWQGDEPEKEEEEPVKDDDDDEEEVTVEETHRAPKQLRTL